METMADESAETPQAESQPEPAAVAAPAAPAVDEEKVRLQTELQQSKAALEQVAGMVQRGELTYAQAKAAAPVEEDDTALVDRKELKRREAELSQRVAGAILQQTAQTARLSRASATELLRPSLKNFGKYESEINQILDKVADPMVAANPETIKHAYRLARANHIDEEIEEERKSFAALPREDEDIEESVPSRIAGSLPSAGRSGVAPVGDANFSRGAASRSDTVVKPLNRDEKVAAYQIFQGLFKDAAEWRKYGDKTWKPDMLGSKGRQKF